NRPPACCEELDVGSADVDDKDARASGRDRFPDVAAKLVPHRVDAERAGVGSTLGSHDASRMVSAGRGPAHMTTHGISHPCQARGTTGWGSRGSEGSRGSRGSRGSGGGSHATKRGGRGVSL